MEEISLLDSLELTETLLSSILFKVEIYHSKEEEVTQLFQLLLLLTMVKVYSMNQFLLNGYILLKLNHKFFASLIIFLVFVLVSTVASDMNKHQV